MPVNVATKKKDKNDSSMSVKPDFSHVLVGQQRLFAYALQSAFENPLVRKTTPSSSYTNMFVLSEFSSNKS